MRIGKRTLVALAFALALASLAPGCGGGGNHPATSTSSDMATQRFRVQPGRYTVSDLQPVGVDSCMQNLDATSFPTLGVNNDGQGTLSLGSNNSSSLPDPGLYSYGTGMFTDSVHATTRLQADANVTGCLFHLVRVSKVTVVGDNLLGVSYQQTQSRRTGSCTVAASDCTSAYDFTLSRPLQ